jgi:hypothetical protein
MVGEGSEQGSTVPMDRAVGEPRSNGTPTVEALARAREARLANHDPRTCRHPHCHLAF